jgi:endogenous inhibitor of DNA gyrase (YacG/DUF329 family)
MSYSYNMHMKDVCRTDEPVINCPHCGHPLTNIVKSKPFFDMTTHEEISDYRIFCSGPNCPEVIDLTIKLDLYNYISVQHSFSRADKENVDIIAGLKSHIKRIKIAAILKDDT